MALTLAVVFVALLVSSHTVRRMLPSESLVAFGLSAGIIVALFELDRMG